MLWQFQVVPRWQQYQEQLACGAGHVCKTSVSIAPGKTRLFLALIENARITVVELPDASGADSHVYLGAVLSGDWQNMTIQIKEVPHNGYDDIALSSPDFGGAQPLLSNDGHGHYGWNR